MPAKTEQNRQTNGDFEAKFGNAVPVGSPITKSLEVTYQVMRSNNSGQSFVILKGLPEEIEGFAPKNTDKWYTKTLSGVKW